MTLSWAGYFFVLFFALLIGLRLWAWRRSDSLRGRPAYDLADLSSQLANHRGAPPTLPVDAGGWKVILADPPRRPRYFPAAARLSQRDRLHPATLG